MGCPAGPKLNGVPLWRGMKKRIAKKYINAYSPGLFERLMELVDHDIKPGSLIADCSSYNGIVIDMFVELKPAYPRASRRLWKDETKDKGELHFGRVPNGEFVADIDFMTSNGGCSFLGCGVQLPRSFEEILEDRRGCIRDAIATGDEWDFAKYAKTHVLLPDGTCHYVPDETFQPDGSRWKGHINPPVPDGYVPPNMFPEGYK